MSNKLAFLNQEAPANYVAGLGRGATGFTTRSDIGPAAEGPDEETLQAAIAAQAAARENAETGGDQDVDGQFQDPENETGLFANAPYDREDEEADRTYDLIEDTMMTRRNKRARAEDGDEEEEVRRDKNGTVLPPIRSQFTELKRGLATVTDDEWANLPEVGDLTRKHKRQKQQQKEQRYYAVPDSVIAGAQDSTQYETSIEASGVETGTTTDFVEMGQARDKILGIKLDQASLKAGASSSIDPKGYLTGLESQVVQSSAEIGDVKKARLLLQSVTQTNPKHAPGWIAAARLEEVAGKQVQARQLAAKGCEHCPLNEDIWLESARLNGTDNAKRILAQAVTHLPESVKIWIQAMRLETENVNQRRVMRKALEIIPQSVRLWKEAVNLEEDPKDAKLLLARATELIPLSIELWLALARLETYDNARKVLNKARASIRTSYEIWIAAARLEEQQGNGERVPVVIKRAITELTRYGGMLSREQWLLEAEKNEEDGGILTAQAIVAAVLDMGLDEEDKKDTWMDDAAGAIERSHVETARAIFAFALRVLPTKKSIWRKAAEFEKSLENRANLFEVLDKGVSACPHSEILWLMYAKEKWLSGDLVAARDILASSFEHNPNSEDIWLAAVKLETENGELDNARQYLARARREAGTERIFIRSAVFERQAGRLQEALVLVNEGLAEFSKSEKLWLIKGQLYELLSNTNLGREAYSAAVKLCKTSVPIWVAAARLEEQDDKVIRARALLDRARLANKSNETLWYHSIQLELRTSHVAQAKNLISKALQECPKSGLLWSEQIFQEPKNARIPRATDALHKCETDPHLVSAIGRIFWDQRKYEKAGNWMGKAIKGDIDNGDSWGWYYKFLVETTPLLATDKEKEDRARKIEETLLEAEKADPKHGLLWPAINKADKNIKAPLQARLEQFAGSVKVLGSIA
ncbi:protein of unknown function [Taphrina deformans PYCC 5710]|uniref:Uncharacterized protein n=1 Tax=Taphrina deformans (strain PYCC 5710 / ATCC 11124 / CBS 356.35 / IMI 108563 / JCM 9778 / NBRC 8474) TaxID=1097556 RepID=R4XHZ4_TAPDE|nr:protein of unknown function [Taphrina deformans PYCC 5710]|eukprot:CCG84124.1 protein of unknown function [Taphrina deformans PYCC 5710]